jgi:hypothetical protein
MYMLHRTESLVKKHHVGGAIEAEICGVVRTGFKLTESGRAE